MRDKHPKPMIGKAPAERYNVSLPVEVADALRVAGNGNLSAGIRLAAESLKRKAGEKR